MIHIFQGGTLQAYCGRSIIAGDRWVWSGGGNLVGWELASKATCPDCRGHFVGHGLEPKA